MISCSYPHTGYYLLLSFTDLPHHRTCASAYGGSLIFTSVSLWSSPSRIWALPHISRIPPYHSVDSYRTLTPFVVSSTAFGLISGFCPSGQMFASGFLQIQPYDGYPCLCLYESRHWGALGLSPVRAQACWTNKIPHDINPSCGICAGYFTCELSLTQRT